MYLGSCGGDQTPEIKGMFIVNPGSTLDMLACHTGGPRGPGLNHGESSVTLEHDLPTISNFSHVWPSIIRTVGKYLYLFLFQMFSPVFVESSLAYEQYFAMIYESRKLTVH